MESQLPGSVDDSTGSFHSIQAFNWNLSYEFHWFKRHESQHWIPNKKVAALKAIFPLTVMELAFITMKWIIQNTISGGLMPYSS